jgi:hypothetical protein
LLGPTCSWELGLKDTVCLPSFGNSLYCTLPHDPTTANTTQRQPEHSHIPRFPKRRKKKKEKGKSIYRPYDTRVSPKNKYIDPGQEERKRNQYEEVRNKKKRRIILNKDRYPRTRKESKKRRKEK